MKLVDILARELKVWPADDITYASQDWDKEIRFYGQNGDEGSSHHDFYAAERANDGCDEETCAGGGIEVTRSQWQAAVDAMKAEKACDHYFTGMNSVCVKCGHDYAEHEVAEWNGEGLPPIGMDVEVFAKYSHPQFDRFIGRKVHVIAHDLINGDPVAVFRMPINGRDPESDQDYHAMVAGSFRPIRTPEQIAAEERDRTIDEMTSLSPLLDKGWSRMVASELYDAGYRKSTPTDN